MKSGLHYVLSFGFHAFRRLLQASTCISQFYGFFDYPSWYRLEVGFGDRSIRYGVANVSEEFFLSIAMLRGSDGIEMLRTSQHPFPNSAGGAFG